MKRISLSLIIFIFLFSGNSWPATIDKMTVAAFGGYTQSYDPDNYEDEFMIFGMADRYFLNDGSFWDSGAGWNPNTSVEFVKSIVYDTEIKYFFDPPVFYVLFQNRDYDSGDHSSQGVLTIASDPVITARRNSKLAQMEGYARIESNDTTGSEGFNYYSASPGAWVYYHIEYWNYSGYWGPTTFNQAFEYNLRGYVDFSNTVPEPSSEGMLFLGALGILGFTRKMRS